MLIVSQTKGKIWNLEKLTGIMIDLKNQATETLRYCSRHGKLIKRHCNV